MNARERLLRSFRHEPVDRVPISTYELVGWNPDAWENHEPSYRRLMDEIRVRTDCLLMSGPEWIEPARPFRTVKTWREGGRVFTQTILQTNNGTLEQLQREDDSIHTVWTIEHYLKEAEDINAFLALPYELPQVSFDRYDMQARQLGEHGLMMLSVPDPICEAAELFSMEDFLVLARTETAKIKYFLDALYERQQEKLRQILAHDVRDVVIRICGPEYATPPYLPPELFRELVTVYLIPVCRQIRDAGSIPRIHCHGRIGAVIDQFAETDALAIDPLEPPPDGDISLAEIKHRFGHQFCLMGNIELRELENGDPRRIDQLVRQVMEAAKADGGFILMPTAAPINIPLSPRTEANYLQMIDSARIYGQYE
jgi:hypothetical protein